MAEQKRETLAALGGRKYVFAWAVFVVDTVALFLRFGTLAEWGAIALGIAGFYFGANYATKKSENALQITEARIEAAEER